MQTNRQQLFINIEKELKVTNKSDSWLGLIIIDIRGFSAINRAYSFSCGDALIKHISNALIKISKDSSLSSHLSNDEFSLLVPNLKTPSLISLAASKIAHQLKKPFYWQGKHIAFQLNIGATAIQQQCNTPVIRNKIDALVLTAEHALQHAKKSNLTFHIEDTDQHHNLFTDLTLHADFKDALYTNKLELHYQPQIKFGEHNGFFAEALLRWQHPKRGFIAPNDMLEICDQLDLNLDLTKWVINTALRHIKEWPGESTFNVSINITADIIETCALPDIIKSSLAIWGVNPQQLTIELTESAVLNDKNIGFSNLTQIHKAGVNISIDDFGTGYSSLEYFKHIPANEIKIDRSFVSHMNNDDADKKLVKLIIDLAHSFNMHVVGEGVENQEVADILKQMGCNLVQGYHYSKALNYSDYIKWNNKNILTSPL